MKTVLCGGCFDLLHPGHIAHLEEARAMGDRLVVALTKDDHIDKGPGRPVFCWQDRADMLRALRWVDDVIATRSLAAAVLMVMPSIVAKGIDYAEKGLMPAEVEACRLVGAEIRFTIAAKRSSSEIIERMRA